MLDNNRLGQHIHRSLNATTIRKALVLRFVGLIAFSFLVLTVALYYFVVVPVARETASDELARAAEKIGARVETVVSDTERIAWIVRDWARNSEITLDNFQNFGLLLAPILRQNSVMGSALFADNNGRELMLLQIQKGKWRIRITDREKWGNRQKVLLWDDNGRVLSDEWIENDYDPRKRPWHVGAMSLASDDVVHWTEPYIFFTTKDPGMTASVRLSKSPAGGPVVLAFDNSLIDLSRITSALKIGERGRMALMMQDGRMVGVPNHAQVKNDDDIRRFVLKRPADTGFEQLAVAWDLWGESDRPYNQPLRFKSAGDDWLATFVPVRLGEKSMVIVATAPIRDFLPDWLRRAALLLGGLLAGVLTVAAVSALIVARKFSTPLEDLAASSARLAAMNLDDPVQTQSSLRELRDLADTQERMRLALRESMSSLERTNQELEQRVEQRTRDLAEREAYFRAIFEHTAVGIIARNMDRKVLGVNSAYEKLVGYTRAELESLDAAKLMRPEDIARAKEMLERLKNGELSSYSMERCYRRKDGSELWADVITSAIRDESGKLLATATMINDISERKAAE